MPQDHLPRGQQSWKPGKYEQGYLAHRILRDRLYSTHLEEDISAQGYALKHFTRVLDIACGAGSRALALAREYTHLEVTGMEIDPSLRAYAEAQAEAQGVENVHFLPLERPFLTIFPDAAFDLLHVSPLGNFLLTAEWQTFLQACLRVTRPGGYFHMLEMEWGRTNSPALEQLGQLCLAGLRKLDKTINLACLPALCTQAGWQEVQCSTFIRDYLMDESLPADPAQRRAILAHQWEPLIVEQNVASSALFEYLMNKAEKEMNREDFCGIQFSLAVSARKTT